MLLRSSGSTSPRGEMSPLKAEQQQSLAQQRFSLGCLLLMACLVFLVALLSVTDDAQSLSRPTWSKCTLLFFFFHQILEKYFWFSSCWLKYVIMF